LSDIEPENKSDTNITESLGSAASRDLRVVLDCNPNNTDFVKIKLNIPPFASSASQMSAGDVAYITRKIAALRIHTEHAINQIKNFKLVNRRIPATLFHSINECFSS
jgi:hypothetical protein